MTKTTNKPTELNDLELDNVNGGLKLGEKKQDFTATDDLWVKGGQEGEPKQDPKGVSGLGPGGSR